MRAKVTKIGNSTGVILPKAVAERLKVKQGDVDVTGVNLRIRPFLLLFLFDV
jgi:antitoxin component of MazEF toxin-antitoxin module